MNLLFSGLHQGLPHGPRGAHQEVHSSPDWESGSRVDIISTGNEEIMTRNNQSSEYCVFEDNPAYTFSFRSHQTATTEDLISTDSALMSLNTRNMLCGHHICPRKNQANAQNSKRVHVYSSSKKIEIKMFKQSMSGHPILIIKNPEGGKKSHST